MAKAAALAIIRVNTAVAQEIASELHLAPEIVEKVVLLLEHDLEIAEGRMARPELAREGRVLGRNREQEHVIDRNQGPQQDRDADQQQGRFGADAAHELGAGHFDSRFIMTKTSGRISGRAHTIEAMASPTWSSRR